MKKFEINTMFLGNLFVDIEANSEDEAKQKFLQNIGTKTNINNEQSVTFENIQIGDIKLDELNILFNKEISDEDVKFWFSFDINEI